jgi:thymidylate synthase (FAD)
MPIFIARQWIRHRTANVNEYSGRYSIIPDTFYRPTVQDVQLDARRAKAAQLSLWEAGVRKQSSSNRQGGEEPIPAETAQDFLDYLARAEALYTDYQRLTDRGVSRELARIGLPVSVYTQWYWKCDLHNILRFLSLRMDSHAQIEIRRYRVDTLVSLVDEAALSIEYGHFHNKTGRWVEGLYIITRATI